MTQFSNHRVMGVAMKVPNYMARVYKQNEPKAIHGTDPTDYSASLEFIGCVYGSYNQCWSQAREMTKLPILELKEEP